MSIVMVELTAEAALTKDPESDEAKIQNLFLNFLGGLTWENMSQDEKDLLIRNGYKPDE